MSGKRKNSNQNYFAPDYNEDEASRWTNNRRRKKIKELELKYSSNNIRNNLIEDNVGVKTNSLNASEVSSLDNVFHVESNINFSDHVPHTYNSTPMSVNNTNDRFQECTLEDNQVSSDGKNQKSSDNENEESSNEENLDSSVEENEESSDEENLDSSDEENQESTDEEVIVDNANIHHGCFTKDNRIMFPSSELSVSDVLLMIKGFNIKFGTTRAMQQALLDFVKVLAGPNFELWDYSTYKLSKTLAPPKETIQKKYYCTECSILLIDLDISRTKKIKVLCHECQKMYEITSESHNYIIALDIKFQLNNLFNQPHIQKSMKINFEKIHNKTTSSISDITDSILFNENIKDPDIMTFNFSADGAQLFESSQKSMWPLQLTLNCLNGKDRFKYPILVALWETEHEPSAKFMNFYLSELKVQCDRINENGIQIVDNINGEITNWRMICPFSANVDTVARPIMQNRIQFNGYYGCSWCYHPGLYTVTMRYPLLDQRVPDPVLRSHTSHLEDLEWVKSSGCLSERGVKGPCSLLDLKNFDIVWNLPPDYMHGSLMGVTKQLHASWKKSLKKEKYNRLIERMSNIRLTNAFQRSLRSLKFVGKYKALEWKMWLLYVSVPCLYGILPPDEFESYLLFANSIYVLLQNSVSSEDLNSCECNLLKFVGECEENYTCEFMTFNVHSLLHYCESVRQVGPLLYNSAFSFESTISKFLNEINAPTGSNKQVANKWLQRFIFRNYITSNQYDSKISVKFCSSLFEKNPLPKNFIKIKNVYLLGNGSTNLEVEKIMQGFTKNNMIKILVFQRCYFGSEFIHSVKYSRIKKTDDTVVKLKNGTVVQIHYIVKAENECFICGCKWKIIMNTFGNDEHGTPILQYIYKVDKKETSLEIWPMNAIEKKVLVLDIKEVVYISYPPNNIEIH
ncbi:hypothetical protein TKK_0009904 [Trichogramma kaykai]